MIVFLLAACTEAPPPEPAPEPLDASWIATVVREPARFTAALDATGGRDAWTAFHRNDWLAAHAAAPSVAGKRASAELAVFEGVLWATQSAALLALADGWHAHSPDSPEPRWLLASAQRVAELRQDGVTADRWRTAAAMSGVGVDASAAKPFVFDRPTPLGVDELRALSAAPLQDPALGSFWDPTRPLALQRAYAADAAPPPADLQDVLFGALPDAAVGDRPASDDVEACRVFTQALDARLDAWGVRLEAGATNDGRALLTQLQLVAVGRSRTLSNLAVDALDHARPACAAFYAEQALDRSASRTISPVNSPTLFAVLAAANVANGHVREALDALTALRVPFPEATGVIETVGDLAVQQGLDRSGISREN